MYIIIIITIIIICIHVYLNHAEVSIFCLPGWLSDETGTYDLTFFVAGVIMLVSGLMLFAIPCMRRCDRNSRDHQDAISVDVDPESPESRLVAAHSHGPVKTTLRSHGPVNTSEKMQESTAHTNGDAVRISVCPPGYYGDSSGVPNGVNSLAYVSSV